MLLGSPAIDEVDVIEIEPEMIRGARDFLPRVARAYDDPRARYFIEDARAFFARAGSATTSSFPSRRIPGSAASRRSSRPSSIVMRSACSLRTGCSSSGSTSTTWIGRSSVRSCAAIGTVFSDYVLYAANDTDIVLVASRLGNLPPVSDALFAWPAMRAELEYLGIRTPADLALFRVATRRAYAPLLETGRINADYFPYLEFGAARARFLNTSYPELVEVVREPVPMLEILSHFDAPRLAQPSGILTSTHPRFGNFVRANLFAEALASSGAPSPAGFRRSPSKSFARPGWPMR